MGESLREKQYVEGGRKRAKMSRRAASGPDAQQVGACERGPFFYHAVSKAARGFKGGAVGFHGSPHWQCQCRQAEVQTAADNRSMDN